ncbi:MAG TPA: flagellar assembly peptidoglycan hydrolase FlgJ [Parasulfuritortus sp.]
MLSSGADLSSQLSFDVQGAAALRMKAASGDPAALKAAARQFEAMFVQTMLKTMRQTHFTSEGDVFGDSSSLKLYQELLDQQWAQTIAGGRGLGFADMIVKRLTQDATNEAAAQRAAGGQAAQQADQTKQAAHESLHQQVIAAPTLPMFHPQGQTADPSGDANQHSAGKNPHPGQGQERKQHFIEAMLPYAQIAEKVSGVPADFVLAHAALESGWGRREIVAADGTASHNLFGIKADGGWNGNVVSTTTTEYRQGLAMKISAKFRAYADYAEAFTDYAKLLKKRYHDAVEAGSDAAAFATGVAAGGYATDPAYAGKLQEVIRSVSRMGA